MQSAVKPDQTLTLHFSPQTAAALLLASGSHSIAVHPNRASLVIVYAYGDFTSATNVVRSSDPASPGGEERT